MASLASSTPGAHPAGPSWSCPDCGRPLVATGGCALCPSCGHSPCD